MILIHRYPKTCFRDGPSQLVICKVWCIQLQIVTIAHFVVSGNITVVDADQTTEVSASISIPQDIIDLLHQRPDVRIAFTFYREPNLFPVTNTSANAERTVVGSSVLGTQIAYIMNGMVLSSPVGLNFTLNSAGTPGENETASPRCVFWDFSGKGKIASLF